VHQQVDIFRQAWLMSKGGTQPGTALRVFL
jgi:hypothetical protein